MTDFKDIIASEIFDEALGLTQEEVKGLIEIPNDEKMGDYAFPCFRLAKALRKAPQMIAADIAGRISGNEAFEKVENVNAYVNFFINRAFFAGQVIDEVNEKGDAYGRSDIGKGRKVIVEYSSPNIAKPFHIGHIRSTVIGNAIYKLYDAYEKLQYQHKAGYQHHASADTEGTVLFDVLVISANIVLHSETHQYKRGDRDIQEDPQNDQAVFFTDQITDNFGIHRSEHFIEQFTVKDSLSRRRVKREHIGADSSSADIR